MCNKFNNMLYQYNNPKSYMDFLHVDFCINKNQLTSEFIETIEYVLKKYGDLKISSKDTKKGSCEFTPIKNASKMKKIIIHKSGYYRIF